MINKLKVRLTESQSAKEKLIQLKKIIESDYIKKPNTEKLFNDFSNLIDELLVKIFKKKKITKFSLIAVGGYGRKNLFPYSDIDILLLKEGPDSDFHDSNFESFLNTLWDLGLEIGHSVRNLEECIIEAKKDITVLTNLLESRFICGNIDEYKKLKKVIKKNYDIKSFFNAKIKEKEIRYSRFNYATNNLEPNIKDNPGALRDLHLIIWISNATKLGASWKELLEKKIILKDEYLAIKKNEDILSDFRIRLHFLAKKREDNLLFDYQETLAKNIITKDVTKNLMQIFFNTTKSNIQLSEIILSRLKEIIFKSEINKEIKINDDFKIVNGKLDYSKNEILSKNASNILQIFKMWKDLDNQVLGLSVKTLRKIWRVQKKLPIGLNNFKANRNIFMEILTAKDGQTHTLRRMHQYGILGKYLPEFNKITGQMQYDLYHTYTVDEHSLMVIRNLRRFAVPQMAHEFPLCSSIMSNFKEPEILYIAGLYHDIGKGSGKDHSLVGKKLVKKFCTMHEISKRSTKIITWLVENHLLMSVFSQKKDLSNQNEIKEFTKIVKTKIKLDALYLLTVADIRGTSPKVWNSWKANLLENLYTSSKNYLHSEKNNNDDLESIKISVVRKLSDEVNNENIIKFFLNSLEISYFLNHSRNEIEWHTKVLHHFYNKRNTIVKARDSHLKDCMQITIYTSETTELFSKICSYFKSISLSIVEAKIHTTKNEYALDSFIIFSENINESFSSKVIEKNLLNFLKNYEKKIISNDFRVIRQLKYFPIVPKIEITIDEKKKFHYMNLVGFDRIGLLYDISQILIYFDISVFSAKIVTLGKRSECYFLIKGKNLFNSKKIISFEKKMKKILVPLR